MVEFAVRLFNIVMSSLFLLVCLNTAIKEFVMRNHLEWKHEVIFHILAGIVFLICLILFVL